MEVQNKKKGRKRKSEVWEHFKDSGKGDGKVICNHCDGMFDGSSKKGTTHLKNHLKSITCRAKRNGDLASTPVVLEEKSSVIDLINNGFDALRKPFACIGIPTLDEFWEFDSRKDEIFQVLMSRRVEILQVYEEEKEKFGGFLNKLSCRFSLEIVRLCDRTLLIVQYIDDCWELKTKIINIWGVDENDIEEMKQSCLALKIDSNICSVLLVVYMQDDGIESWFSERGSLPFVGSGLHFQRFIVDFQKRTKQWEKIKIDGLRECVEYGYKTSSNGCKLRCAVNSAKTMGKNVIFEDLPILSCYNPPLDYLEAAINLKEAFSELEKIDPDFVSINLTKQKWEEATATFEHLNALKEICKSLQRSKQPPIIKPVHILKSVRCNRSEDCHVCKYALPQIKEFFVEIKAYWVLVILDPRLKIDTVKRCYEEIYASDAAVDYLEKTIQDFRDIYNKYVKDSSDDYKMLDAMATSSTKSELDLYLHDLKVPAVEDFDILAWWRGNARFYPTLARMARDYLAIPFHPIRIDSKLKYEIDFIYDHFQDDIVSQSQDVSEDDSDIVSQDLSKYDSDIVSALIYLRGLLYY